MPDKEGSDDEKKSTKSVVNKKQKQMMNQEDYLPEEGYDIARDMGKVSPSKDKKDATTMPPSKEMKKTQKVNKGPSALDIVKKKYGKSVMNVGKKKANEELDLTKVAEAFGGHIVEARKINKKIGTVKPGEKEATAAAVRTSAEIPQLSPEGQKRLEKISKKSIITKDTVSDFKKKLDQLKSGSRPVDDSTIRGMGTETDREFDSRSQSDKSDAARKSYNRIARELRRPEYANPEKPAPKKPTTTKANYPKTRAELETKRKEYEIDPKTNQPSDAGVEKFARRRLSRKQQASGSNVPIELSKSDLDTAREKLVGGKPVMGMGDKGVKDRVIGTTTGKYGGTMAKQMSPKNLQKLRTKLKTKSFVGDTEPKKPEAPQDSKVTTGNQIQGPLPAQKTQPKPSKISMVAQAAKNNPAAALAAYDLGKGIIGKITKLRMPAVQGGKAGFRSAGG